MGRLEQTAEASQILKLHRGGASSGDGGVHPAPDGILLQRMEEGHGVFRRLKGVEHRKVGKGLVHDPDDVDGLDIRSPLHGGVLVHQLPHRVFGVALWLVHRAVPQSDGKVEQKAVALGDPLLGVDVQSGQHPGAEEGEAIAQHCRPQQSGPPQRRPGPLFLGGTGPHQEQIGRQQDGRLGHIPVHGVIEALSHIGGGPPAGNVRREQDTSPEPENKVVDQPRQKGQAGPQSGGPPVPARIRRQTTNRL